MSTVGVYLHAFFELFVGFNFLTDASSLHGGYEPKPGFESFMFQCFGIGCIFWGLALLFNATHKPMLKLNLLWNAVWVAFLGAQMAGYSTRAETAIGGDTSFYMVPVVAHSIAFVGTLFALSSVSASMKMKKV